MNQIVRGNNYYKEIRLINRNVYRLVTRKRLSLSFNVKDITERVFFNLVEKSARRT